MNPPTKIIDSVYFLRGKIYELNRQGDYTISFHNRIHLENLVSKYYPRISKIHLSAIVDRLYKCNLVNVSYLYITSMIANSIRDWDVIDRYDEPQLRQVFTSTLENIHSEDPIDEDHDAIIECMVERFLMPNGLESREVMLIKCDIKGFNLKGARNILISNILSESKFEYLQHDRKTLLNYVHRIMKLRYKSKGDETLDSIIEYIRFMFDYDKWSHNTYREVYMIIKTEMFHLGIELSRHDLNVIISSLLPDIEIETSRSRSRSRSCKRMRRGRPLCNSSKCVSLCGYNLIYYNLR
jgi:hypothetical protein